MAGRTPGEWGYRAYSYPERFSGFIFGRTTELTYIVAEVVGHDGMPDSLGEPFDNGPLLSAAPDMLAALEVLTHNWDTVDEDSRPEGMTQALAAIAKAKGAV